MLLMQYLMLSFFLILGGPSTLMEASAAHTLLILF